MSPDAAPSSTPDVVLHQEQLQVGTSRVAVRAVLRRRIVTEVRRVEVEVRREVLEVEHVPATEQDVAALASTGAPLVLVLSEEVPVVTLATRPYERVTVDVETVTEDAPVTAELATEHAEVTSTVPIVEV